MTPEKLAEILAAHKLWLNDEKGGVMANLSRANLSGANLRRADLSGAKELLSAYPNNAEVYSLEEWQESGYGAGDVCKVDEPVQMCIGFCKKYKKYDTVLVPLNQYVKYCECACLPLDKPKED